MFESREVNGQFHGIRVFLYSGMHSVPEMGIYAGWVAHENSFGAAQPFCQ